MKFGAASNAIFEDLSCLTATPEEFPPLAHDQMAQLIADLPEHMGHDHQSIATFRDKVLVELLRMHHRL